MSEELEVWNRYVGNTFLSSTSDIINDTASGGVVNTVTIKRICGGCGKEINTQNEEWYYCGFCAMYLCKRCGENHRHVEFFQPVPVIVPYPMTVEHSWSEIWWRWYK